MVSLKLKKFQWDWKKWWKSPLREGDLCHLKWLTAQEQKLVGNIHFTRGNQAFTPSPIRRGRIWGKYIHKLGMDGFYLFMRGRLERNNNANPDEEVQLPRVWSRFVVNQAAADIMWIDSAQTTFDCAERQRAGGRIAEAHWCYGPLSE